MKKTWNKRILRVIVSMAMLCAMVVTNMPVQLHAEEVNEVAAIGDTNYATLQEAFTASGEEQTTITLLTDFTMKTDDIATLSSDKNIILNMNGKTINVASDFEGRPIVNEGTMLINGNGTIDSSMAQPNGTGAVNNKGDLTIENGTYSGYILGNGSVIRNTSGNLVINGGTFNKATAAVYNDAGASAVINGGVFDGRTCSRDNENIWSYTFRNEGGTLEFNNGTVYGVQGALSISGGTATINGGHFETLPCATHGASASYYALYVAGEVAVVQTTVNGGEFISANQAAARIGNDDDGGNKEVAKCIINGGNFTTKGTVDVMIIAPETGQPSLRGGTYNKAVTNGIESGFGCYAKDGKYVVTPTPSGIALSKSALSIKEGDSDTISATITPSTSAAAVVWSNSDETIASVNDGVITAKKAGIATITATAGDKTANATITVFKMTTPTTPPAIDPEEPVEEVKAGVDSSASEVLNEEVNTVIKDVISGSETTQVNEETVTKLKEAVETGKTISLVVETNTVDKNKLPSGDEKKIEAILSEAMEVAQYLDLSLDIMADGSKIGTLDTLDKPITFTLAVPEDLKKENRVFTVIRVHDGKAEKLATTQNEDGTLSFETDKFSTYALVYEDAKEPTEPIKPTEPNKPAEPVKPTDPNKPTDAVNTGDTTNAGGWVLLMAGALGVLVVTRKKKEKIEE